MRKKIKHGFHGMKKKTYVIYDKFDRKDIAQMLSSLFVIVQVFTLRTTQYGFNQAILLFVVSVFVCGLIVWLMARSYFLKHLVAGVLIVGIFSFLIKIVLNESVEKMLIAFAVGLPVAAMVNALKK